MTPPLPNPYSIAGVRTTSYRKAQLVAYGKACAEAERSRSDKQITDLKNAARLALDAMTGCVPVTDAIKVIQRALK